MGYLLRLFFYGVLVRTVVLFVLGLNVRHRAFADVFPTLGFTAHMLGDRRVYAVAARHCLPD